MSRPRSVLIVDDESDIRFVLRATLEASELAIEVVGEAIDADEAMARLRDGDPVDVVILDQRMPGRSGLEAAEDLLAELPEQRVVLFATHITDEMRERAEAVGIAACVGKLDIDRLPAIVHEITPG